MPSNIGSLHETCGNVLNVEWKIEGFLSLIKPEARYNSPTFKFSDFSWCLDIGPCVKSREDKSDSVSLYLNETRKFSTDVVICKVGLKKANGVLFLPSSCVWKFSKGTAYGWPEICTRSELLERKTDLLPSDTLTISCTMEKFPSPRGLNSLILDFEDMLTSPSLSDVTIHVKSKDYKAHKCILAARSPVFSAMFKHEMTEKNSGDVSIADCDPESFKDFLGFLYTGRADITECNFAHLYKTADKYCVEGLKRYCDAFMIQNLSLDNIFDVAVLGDQYSVVDINNYCKTFFEENVKDILMSSEWMTFMRDHYRIADKLLKSFAPNIKT